MNSRKTHEILKRNNSDLEAELGLANGANGLCDSVYHKDHKKLKREMINTDAVVQMVANQKALKTESMSFNVRSEAKGADDLEDLDHVHPKRIRGGTKVVTKEEIGRKMNRK